VGSPTENVGLRVAFRLEAVLLVPLSGVLVILGLLLNADMYSFALLKKGNVMLNACVGVFQKTKHAGNDLARTFI